MKECEVISFELPGYVNGKLDPSAAGPVRTHLQLCATCRGEAVQIQRLDKLLKDALPTIVPSPGFASTFANRLAAEVVAEERAAGAGWGSWLLQPWLVGLAATAMLTIVMIGALNFSRWSPHTSMPGIPNFSSLITREPAGEGLKVASNPLENGKASASNVPPDVLRRPELFVDYAVIRDLDILESGAGGSESPTG